jgi:hypothetical protein
MKYKIYMLSVAMAAIMLGSMVGVASATTPAITSVTTAPAVVWTGHHEQLFFIQGDNGNLWGLNLNGRIGTGHYATWTDMGVPITSSPYAVAGSTQHRDGYRDPTSQTVTVFFATASGGIASSTSNDAGRTWSAETAWPGTVAPGTGPAAVINPATSAFDVFYVDSASLHLMEDSLQVNIIPPASSVVTDLGGVVTATPAVVSPVNGFVDVVVRGTGGHIWERTFETGGWGPWTPFHDGTIGYGAVMTNPGGTNVDLFVAGSDYRLYELQSSDNGVSWHNQYGNIGVLPSLWPNLDWIAHNGVMASQPSASLYQDHMGQPMNVGPSGHQHGGEVVAMTGQDGNIWLWTSPPGQWDPTPIPNVG